MQIAYLCYSFTAGMNNKIIAYAHALLTLCLAVYFINAGMKKFSHRPLRPVGEKELIETVIVRQDYTPPVGYNVTMNTFRQNGFLKMIGVFQLLSAALMFLPRTRLLGLLLLLPIIFNIFFMHVFLDNRMHENVETGILLGVNLLLIIYYYKRIVMVLWHRPLR